MKNRAVKFFLSLIIVSMPFFLNGAEVDLNGFLSHTVEIKLPPGTNGMAPNLSLEYNSGSGNGILGQGWSLNGLPAITRDTTNGVKYDGTDKFIGSSGRLKLQSDGTYHYEYENYSVVKKYEGTAENPKYWIETKPDGTKYYYGNYGDIDTASVQAVDKNGAIRVWALSRVEDLNGNYYEVNYVHDNGEYYPEKIVYTLGNGTDRIISKKRTVEFEYEGRGDYWPGYWQSARVETRNRLKSITVSVDVININFFNLFEIELGGRTVNTYELEYEGGTSGIDPSRIVMIKESGSDGAIVDSTSFTWSKFNDSIDFTPSGSFNINNTNLMSSDGVVKSVIGDFNGDGKTDILRCFGEKNGVYISNGDGSFQRIGLGILSASFTNSNGTVGVITGDFNGDGKTDILNWSDVYSNNKLFISNGNGTFTSSGSFNIKDTCLKHSNETIGSITGDFNGDGKVDLLRWCDTYSDNKLFISATRENERIVSISSLIGNKINIEYKNVSEIGSAIYPSNSSYPVIIDSFPRKLVTLINVYDGRGAVYNKTYDYFNGKFHTGFPEERKNLFFEKIVETDSSTGITTTTLYDQNEWSAGNITFVESSSASGTLKTVKYDLNPDTATKYSNTHFVKVDSVTTREYIGSGSITRSTSFTYDPEGDGNVTGMTDTAAGTPDVLTTISYDKLPGENILNRPSSILNTSGGVTIQDDDFAYSGYNLVSVTRFSSMQTEYTYDNCGNVT